MKFLQYLCYKIFKTYNRIHKVIKLYRGPAEHAVNFVTFFLFSVIFWPTLKFGLWSTRMEIQFIMALSAIFIFLALHYFVEKKVRPKPIGLYMKESKSASIIGAIFLNLFLMLYTLLWFYTL